MKNYEEMSRSVLERIDEYNKEKEKRIKRAKLSLIPLSAVVVLILASFGIWKSGLSGTHVGIDSESDTTEATITDSGESVSKHETPPEVSDELPQITVPNDRSDGMGFEGLMYYSASELENGNPWREETAPDTLPVFRNGSYDPTGAGAPVGLHKQEMEKALESAARVLGVEISETEADPNTGESDDGNTVNGETVYNIRAATSSGTLTVFANGATLYELPDGYRLPEGYRFTHSDTSDSEAEKVMRYLTQHYASFLKFNHPEIVLQGEYTFNGAYVRRYLAYDADADMTERILNYNFRTAQFAPDDNGNLMLIRLNDDLCTAEKIGEYPLISVSRAKEKLLEGKYQTSVPVAMPGETYIAKVELIYRSGPMEETLLPYYRFYVELQDGDGLNMTMDNGLKTFGAFYVPAIQDAYISNLSTYDGWFN